MAEGKTVVAVIVPVYNAARFLPAALASLEAVLPPRDVRLRLALYDDGSRDESLAIARAAQGPLEAKGWEVVLAERGAAPRDVCGPGWARNEAVRAAGDVDYLCFLDADDVMRPGRIRDQLAAARAADAAEAKGGPRKTLVGGAFEREPADATERYTAWCNGLHGDDLYLHMFQDCTLIQPTWFCHRDVFDAVGGYVAVDAAGIGEDLVFFYEHLRRGGRLAKVDTPCITYRYHEDSVSWSTPMADLWRIRGAAFEAIVLGNEAIDLRKLVETIRAEKLDKGHHARNLQAMRDAARERKRAKKGKKRKLGEEEEEEDRGPPPVEYHGVAWTRFRIWGAGRDGKRFFRALTPAARARVDCMIDVDRSKMKQPYRDEETGLVVPVRHFADLADERLPVATCVGLDKTDGAFEANLATLQLTAGKDLVYIA